VIAKGDTTRLGDRQRVSQTGAGHHREKREKHNHSQKTTGKKKSSSKKKEVKRGTSRTDMEKDQVERKMEGKIEEKKYKVTGAS